MISSDAFSEPNKNFRLGSRFPLLYSIYYGHPDSFAVTYQLPGDDNIKESVMAPVPTNRIWGHMNNPKDLGMIIREKLDTAIMTIPNFAFYNDHEKFFGFIDQAFMRIGESGIRNLIIDLRGNSGGDPFCAAHLLAYIMPRPVPYFAQSYGKYSRLAEPVPLKEKHFTGELFILIDGGGFSTTGHLLGLLKYHKVGTKIGEESGGTYTCNDAHKSFQLKHSGFQVGLATSTFASAVKNLCNDQGIKPDIRLYPTAEDLAAGRDTVLDFTLDLIKTQRNTRTAGNFNIQKPPERLNKQGVFTIQPGPGSIRQ